MDDPTPAAPVATKLRDRKGRAYVPAIGPYLKALLFVIFAAVALLGATGVYLLSVHALEAARAQTYTNAVTIAVFMVHIVVGLFIILPFLYFGSTHLLTARTRKNRLAVRLGIILFSVSIVVGLSGLALIQLTGLPQLPTGTIGRNIAYYLHVLLPVAAVMIYILHRRAGPVIRWRWGFGWGGAVAAFVAIMAAMHFAHPKDWYREGPREGERYFFPSAVHTDTGDFISERALLSDGYCLRCHQDVYNDWLHSAHHFATLNNPAYLFSVKKTREVTMKRDGNVRGSRWCAGCHDPVPFLTGAFEDPRTDPKYQADNPRDAQRLERFQEFEDVIAGKKQPSESPMANAGITCVVCHAMTHIDSTVGNGAYTIEEPEFYPFTFSKNPILQWFNNQVVKAKPDLHKKTFLKPFHRTAEFCSTCHKVSIPGELNHYKEFLRGQDHYTTYEVSGVAHGARSFYYPPQGKPTCAACHMPLQASNDFGSRDFDGSGVRKVHDHRFLGGNTGLPWLLSLRPDLKDQAGAFRQDAKIQADFLRDKQMRIDLFGLREGQTIYDPLTAPLRPRLPALKPGKTYLVEVVIRTLGLGHPFTQGTVDSNEVWVDFEARSGNRVIGRNGALSGPDDTGTVDEWAHFVNVLMLDRYGQRIDRRNPEDIFTPLYNHQIPPGAGQVVHYKLDVPADLTEPVTLKVRLRYRKFDFKYMSYVFGGEDKVQKLPIVDLCEDRVTLPVEGVKESVTSQESAIEPAWQRLNDYGIGLFLTATSDPEKPGLRQAEDVFRQLSRYETGDEKAQKAARANGWLNLARVYQANARLSEAAEALQHARELGAPLWTVAWFSGLVNAQNYNFEDAARDFEEILDPKKQPRDRRLDFTKDFVVIDQLGETLYNLAQSNANDPGPRDDYLRRAIARFESTLDIDSEDIDAHFFLSKCYTWLGSEQPAADEAAGPSPTDEKGLTDLARAFADRNAPRADRLRAAAQLNRGVNALGREPIQPEAPRLPRLKVVRGACREVYRTDPDAAVRTAAAAVLGNVHREMHAIYKPDDNAQDKAAAIYRGKHPAAAQASFAVIIYPTNRTGNK